MHEEEIARLQAEIDRQRKIRDDAETCIFQLQQAQCQILTPIRAGMRIMGLHLHQDHRARFEIFRVGYLSRGFEPDADYCFIHTSKPYEELFHSQSVAVIPEETPAIDALRQNEEVVLVSDANVTSNSMRNDPKTESLPPSFALGFRPSVVWNDWADLTPQFSIIEELERYCAEHHDEIVARVQQEIIDNRT